MAKAGIAKVAKALGVFLLYGLTLAFGGLVVWCVLGLVVRLAAGPWAAVDADIIPTADKIIGASSSSWPSSAG